MISRYLITYSLLDYLLGNGLPTRYWITYSLLDDLLDSGSIRMSFTCSGVALYSKLIIIALTATDLPEPVVPATKTWGIFAKSAIAGFPAIVFPIASVKLDLDSL